MSAEIKFKVDDSGQGLSVKVFDLTGAYNATSNPGGYGSPNLTIASVEWATLTFLRRGTTTPYVVDVYDDLPTTDEDFFVQVLGTQIGYATGEKIESDVYNVTYAMGHFDGNDPVTDAYQTCDVPIVPKLKCCIKSVRLSLPVPNKNEECHCQNKDITGLANADQILTDICYAVECDQLDHAQALIAYLKKWCSCNCSSCS